MSTPAWPASLPPRPIREGWKETKPDLALRTEMESGAIKTRRRFTAAPGMLEMRFRFSEAQRATFETFHDVTLADGSLPFTFTHPTTGATLLLLFREAPTFEQPAGRVTWAGSLKLSVLP